MPFTIHDATTPTAVGSDVRGCRPAVVGVPRGTHPYWMDLLARCGVEALVTPTTRPDLVFLAPETAAPVHVRDRWVHDGVPVLGGLQIAARPSATGWQTIQGVEGTGPVFGPLGACRVPMRLPGGALVESDGQGGAPWLALPLPRAEEALAAAPALQGFPIDPAHTVHEIVAGCDHGGLRRLVQRGLAWLGSRTGRGLHRLAHHPEAFAGTFAIRIDADDFDPQATAEVAAHLVESGFRASWFIDVERHERKQGEAAVRALAAQGHEVQSHFYHHYTYRSGSRNRKNLQRSRTVLRRWGIDAQAAVTPFGTYHRGVETALRAEGIAWSSEFSAHFDDGPSRCHGGVQVPVHPVCPILLLQAGIDADGVVRYFADRLAAQLRAGEPALFYGHPIRDLAAVPGLFPALREVLTAHEAATGKPVWHPTLGAFQQWDDARHALLTGAPPQAEERAPALVQVSLPADDLAPHDLRPWRQVDAAALRARQRTIRLRRWLREIRRR